jgi:transcriptional regulator with XRE-family HTH domain
MVVPLMPDTLQLGVQPVKRGIRRARERTAEDVADTIGVSVETLTRWERGQHAIKAFHLAALAEAYGLLPGAYHDLVDPPEPVNPWTDRLSRVEEEADRRFSERADAARREGRTRQGGGGSPAPRAPHASVE